MALRLYNTLTRQLEPFVPVREGEARLYICGMTPYDHAHAGNARSAVAFDVLVRQLLARGFRVTSVRNVTDVDDKILARAKENGEPPLELSARMARIYQGDMRELGCLDPTFEPKVSETIPEIIQLIQEIVAHGTGYEIAMPSGVHDVYFSVRNFAGYGKLSR